MSGTKLSPKSDRKQSAIGAKQSATKKPGKKAIGTNLKGHSLGRARHPSSRANAEPPEWDDIEGIPTKREIADRIEVLPKEQKRTFERLMIALADHLGSSPAARLWLTTPHAGFGESPLDIIVAGRIDAVVEAQEAIWGPNPGYA